MNNDTRGPHSQTAIDRHWQSHAPRGVGMSGLTLALALVAGTPLLGQSAGERKPVATTPLFAFYSDFGTNLNDALIAAGSARRRGEPELFTGGAARTCFDALPGPQRAGWNRAVDYYADIIAPADIFDRRQYLLRLELAGFNDQAGGERAERYVRIAEGFRQAAEPAYAACHWPEQDVENRRWIAGLGALLDRHEAWITQRLAALYQTSWTERPLSVDVVRTVNWSGGNSTFIDGVGGHLLISTSYQDLAALEIAFHEASHGLMREEAPIPRALAGAATALDMEVPEDLWHSVLFFTTGHVVRGALADAGEPDYTPFIYDIFRRGGWTQFQAPLERHWTAYLGGNQALGPAARALLRAIGQSESRIRP